MLLSLRQLLDHRVDRLSATSLTPMCMAGASQSAAAMDGRHQTKRRGGETARADGNTERLRITPRWKIRVTRHVTFPAGQRNHSTKDRSAVHENP
ncbi:MAG TPA: hypothetical protein VHC94_19285 [Nitrobacter sp.]|jgi:hypothetical protein|nr:hypothetical protein [Nitrobacter sp.]